MQAAAREMKPAEREEIWPALPLQEWQDTYATLHMWTQAVGKVRMALSPHVNHWWEVPLYVSARGLSTSAIPYGHRVFEIEFDFLDHNLAMRVSDGHTKFVPLYPRSVADFYREFMATLRSVGIDVKIWSTPVEVDPIPFEQDKTHAAYDPEYANRFWRILLQTDSIFKEFRARFIGKVSPVHFSGAALIWPSHVFAAGGLRNAKALIRSLATRIPTNAAARFWPGSGDIKGPAFYSYTVPEPPGYADYQVRPEKAYYHSGIREFVLMYDDIRRADSPKRELLEFLQSTYEAGAILGQWDRASLEAQSP